VSLCSQACARVPVRVLGYVLMPNHFHLVLWPVGDDHLGAWMHWLLTTHASRYNRIYGRTGHAWQGRFKAFPIQQDDHLLTVLRYVERNPLRANLVGRAEDWPWSSLRERQVPPAWPWLHPAPVPFSDGWVEHVNAPQTETELARLRLSVRRGSPFGEDAWVRSAVGPLGLEYTIQPRGRPRKAGWGGKQPDQRELFEEQ